MLVLKFGGTSVGSVENLKKVAALVATSEPKIVVLSAFSGTTNILVEMAKCWEKKQDFNFLLYELKQKNKLIVNELFKTDYFLNKANSINDIFIKRIELLLISVYSLKAEKELLAMGELISTNIFSLFLAESNVNHKLIDALDFMRTDKDNEPDAFYIKQMLNKVLELNPEQNLFVTQGYICRNYEGEIDNLQRGGSDYSATLIGAAINATEIQIWTDIDGFHNNDPRFVENTHSISQISFAEAAELAYFGAKILHPTCVLPAQKAGISVRLKSTIDQNAEGTLISNKSTGSEVKAVAAKDGIVAIQIRSTRMLMAYGFLRRVFEVFEKYKTPIDMITTSEVAVSVTIDNAQFLNQIIHDLENFCNVSVFSCQSIVCVVGDLLAEKNGLAFKILESLKNIPIRMISYGGSSNNISFLIDSQYKKEALKTLHEHFFSSINNIL